MDDPEDTPTPTPTATATPVSATGSLRAASSTIYVKQSTTVYAEWDPPELTVNLDIATSSQAILWRSDRCSGGVQGSSVPEPPSTATLTVWGCKPGSGTVELRNFSDDTVLASVTITVKNPPPTSTPPAVLNLTSTASTTSVRLSWDDLDGATKYRVEHRLAASTGNWTPVETTANAHTVANLTPGTSYAFRVRAYGDGTKYKAEWGAVASTTVSTVALVVPPAVSNLTATASTTSVRLSWDDLDGATKYRVEHRLSTSTGSWTPVETTANAHRVANLTPGTSYAFKVRAYGDGTKYKAEWGAVASTTVSTVALVVPPAPGGLSASASGASSVSVSWTALTGADKYAVRYRQGSSGNWETDEDDITGASHRVDDLDCDTGYQFSVRAYGDGVTYLAAWGAWSSASSEVRTSTCPTATPTPTPTPPNPTGSIRALPAKIALGAATTIEADWRGVPVEPEIVVVNTSVLSKRADCSGAAGGSSRRSADAPLVSEVSIKLYSCSHGSSVVRLWDEANDKELAKVTVTVLETPSIEDGSVVAYRWLNITWKDSGYDSYSVEWRKEGESDADWVRLSTSTLVVGDRVHITGNSADVRGLEYTQTRQREKAMDVELRVVGHVNNTSAVSLSYDIAMAQPIVTGYLPDHTVKYSLLMLDDTPLEKMVEAASTAASEWAARHDYIWMCAADTDCAENQDGRTITLKVADGGCRTAVACVEPAPGVPGVEVSVAWHRDMIFLSRSAARALRYVWTDVESEHGAIDEFGNRLLWLKAVLRHEFGHTYGLRDTVAGTHAGIMDASNILHKKYGEAILTITDADYAVLEQVYKGHTPNQGW